MVSHYLPITEDCSFENQYDKLTDVLSAIYEIILPDISKKANSYGKLELLYLKVKNYFHKISYFEKSHSKSIVQVRI